MAVNYDNLKARWDVLFDAVVRDPRLPGTPEFERAVAAFDRDFAMLAVIDPQMHRILKATIDVQTGATRAIS